MRDQRIGRQLEMIGAIRRIVQTLDVHSRRLSAEHGITLPQLLCLMAVTARGRLTSQQIAREIFVGPSTLVGVIDRLQAKELIRRRRNPRDRREVHIVPTESGRALVDAIPSPFGDKFRRELLNLDEDEQEDLIGAFDRAATMMGAGASHD